jgi:hypothetical protein
MSTAVFDRIAGLSHEEVRVAIREPEVQTMIRRFVIGDEPTAGPTESFDASVARALLDRFLETA